MIGVLLFPLLAWGYDQGFTNHYLGPGIELDIRVNCEETYVNYTLRKEGEEVQDNIWVGFGLGNDKMNNTDFIVCSYTGGNTSCFDMYAVNHTLFNDTKYDLTVYSNVFINQ